MLRGQDSKILLPVMCGSSAGCWWCYPCTDCNSNWEVKQYLHLKLVSSNFQRIEIQSTQNTATACCKTRNKLWIEILKEWSQDHWLGTQHWTLEHPKHLTLLDLSLILAPYWVIATALGSWHSDYVIASCLWLAVYHCLSPLIGLSVMICR